MKARARMNAHATAKLRSSCSACGREGHNLRTCSQRPAHLGPPKPYTRRAPRARKPIVPDVYELPPAQARPILRRLRPLVRLCAGERAFLDSLMLSCYLRGLLVGAERGVAPGVA